MFKFIADLTHMCDRAWLMLIDIFAILFHTEGSELNFHSVKPTLRTLLSAWLQMLRFLDFA